MDGLKQAVFVAHLSALFHYDPQHEDIPLEEKLKKSYKAAEECCEFCQKQLRKERNNPRKK